MPLHAQRKGKAGEEEFCKWLFDNTGIDVARNLKQSRGKGSDIICDDFLFEVKRREVLDFDSWWLQVCIAAQTYEKKKGLIPVVAYRQNRKKWRFLIPAKLIPVLEKGYVETSEQVFLHLLVAMIATPEEDEPVKSKEKKKKPKKGKKKNGKKGF